MSDEADTEQGQPMSDSDPGNGCVHAGKGSLVSTALSGTDVNRPNLVLGRIKATEFTKAAFMCLKDTHSTVMVFLVSFCCCNIYYGLKQLGDGIQLTLPGHSSSLRGSHGRN